MRIGQVLHSTSWGSITPETIEKGLGGRETAMLKLSEEWAKAGHEVFNFVSIPERQKIKKGDGLLNFVPIGTTRTMLANQDWDAVVAWELPSVFKEEAMRENVRVKICEMQVAHFTNDEMQCAEMFCDYVAALSPWHAEFLQHSGLEMQDDQMVVFPNGIDLKRYPLAKSVKKVAKDWKFVYSSSPDRGLWHLLKMWPKIRKLNSKAELYICYGFDNYVSQARWSHSRNGEMAIEMETLVGQPGVFNVGKIGQKDLAELQLNATAWIYPLDAIWPTETGCITAVENAAAGNPLFISDGDCLADEFGEFSTVIPLPFDSTEWAENIADTLNNEEEYDELQDLGRSFAETRTWEKISRQWLQLFENDPS